jgi:hypothetical protein
MNMNMEDYRKLSEQSKELAGYGQHIIALCEQDYKAAQQDKENAKRLKNIVKDFSEKCNSTL